MRLENRTPALFAGLIALACTSTGQAAFIEMTASPTPKYYSVHIDTSSIAGNSGSVAFQPYSPGGGYTLPLNAMATIRNVASDAPFTTQIHMPNGVNEHMTGPNAGFELTAGGTSGPTYNQNAELDLNFASYGQYLSFDIKFEGDTLLGSNPNAGNYLTGFDLIMSANVPNPFGAGTVPVQVLLDPLGFGTFEFYADNPNHVILEYNDAVTATEIAGFPSAIPEPATLSVLGIGIGALLLRKQRPPQQKVRA